MNSRIHDIRTFRIALFAGGLAMLSAVLMSGCSNGETASVGLVAPPARQVENGIIEIREASLQFIDVETVGDQQVPALVRAPGRIEFKDGAVSRVGAPIEGRVIEMHAHVGDRVEKGAPLVTLSSPAAASVRAALKRASVRVTAATKEYQRQLSMMKDGVGVSNELTVASGRLAEARAELTGLRSKSALLGQAEHEKVIVRAPIAGTVLTRHATPGSSVSPDGEPIMKIGDPDELWLVAEVFGWDFPLIQEGTKAMVNVFSVSDTIQAHVIRLGGSINLDTRRAEVYLALDSSGASLRGGMYAQVTFQVYVQGGISVPSTAILLKNDGRPFVYIARDDRRFESREVEVGHPVEGRIPVFSGLTPGDRLVVRGALLLDSSIEQLL